MFVLFIQKLRIFNFKNHILIKGPLGGVFGPKYRKVVFFGPKILFISYTYLYFNKEGNFLKTCPSEGSPFLQHIPITYPAYLDKLAVHPRHMMC